MMQRIQRKRTKGWRMPDNALYVGRPSRWGNPLKLVGSTLCIDVRYRGGTWAVLTGGADTDLLMHYFWVIATGHPRYRNLMNMDMQYWSDHFLNLDWTELEGKYLACWCPLTHSNCHAEILIQLAHED